MEAPNLAEDICPVSEFRADINSFITKTRETHRPIVLTQRGRSTAVLIDINEYQDMVNRLKVIDAIDTSRAHVANGDFITSEQARKRLLDKYKDV